MNSTLVVGCLLISLTISALAKPEIYEVSKAGSDKKELETVFEAVKAATTPTPFKPKKAHFVHSKLDDQTYLAGQKNKDGIVVAQIHVQLAKPQELATNQPITLGKNAYLLYEKFTHGNDTQLRKVKQIEPKDLPSHQLTQKEFIVNLRFKKNYTVKLPQACKTCNGWGRVHPRSGLRGGSDGKVPCKPCKGKGKTQKTYLVKW